MGPDGLSYFIVTVGTANAILKEFMCFSKLPMLFASVQLQMTKWDLAFILQGAKLTLPNRAHGSLYFHIISSLLLTSVLFLMHYKEQFCDSSNQK